MANMIVLEEFKQRGGTEISPMSMSSERQVAERRALKDYISQRAIDAKNPELQLPTLLKLKAETWQNAGVDISSLSIIPEESEVVYPPCTYLEPRSEKEETVRGPNEEEFTIKIIEVLPQFG